MCIACCLDSPVDLLRLGVTPTTDRRQHPPRQHRRQPLRSCRFGLRGPSATTRLQRCRSCDKAVARSPHCALMRPFGTLRGDHSRAYFTTGTPAIQKRQQSRERQVAEVNARRDLEGLSDARQQAATSAPPRTWADARRCLRLCQRPGNLATLFGLFAMLAHVTARRAAPDGAARGHPSQAQRRSVIGTALGDRSVSLPIIENKYEKGQAARASTSAPCLRGGSLPRGWRCAMRSPWWGGRRWPSSSPTRSRSHRAWPTGSGCTRSTPTAG